MDSFINIHYIFIQYIVHTRIKYVYMCKYVLFQIVREVTGHYFVRVTLISMCSV